MWSRIKEYAFLVYLIAGGMSLLLVLAMMGYVVQDRFSENPRFTDDRLAELGGVIYREAGEKDIEKEEVEDEKPDMAMLTFENRTRILLAEAEKRRLSHGGKDVVQLQTEALTELSKQISVKMDQIQKEQEKLEKSRNDFKNDKAIETRRLALLSGSTLVSYLKAVDAELIASDWKKLYDDAPKSNPEDPDARNMLVKDLAKLFTTLSTTRRADIAAEMDAELRIAITEVLRADAKKNLKVAVNGN